MWLERRLDRIWRHDAVAICAQPELGVNRLISAAARDRPLAWVVLEPNDRDDPIAQGNKLSDALAVAVGSRLFPRATPFQAGVGLLERYLAALSPITFAVSGICDGVELAAGLMALHGRGCRVVVSDSHVPEPILTSLARACGQEMLVLDDAALRLTLSEAKDLAAGRISDAEVRRHLEHAENAYENFLVRICKALGNESRLEECPGTAGVLPDPDVDELLEAGEWRKAAESAVQEAHPRVVEVLRKVAPLFHERGLHRALWRLLSNLPNTSTDDEAILYWKLTAAVRVGRAHEVRNDVELHLEGKEAPDLRALHAGVFLGTDDARPEVMRAYRARQTPFTSYQQGRFLLRASDGARVLKRAVRLAEREGREYEVARNASALTARLIDSGKYSEAASWGEWALDHFDRQELSDCQQRLYILNNWAYARLLTGESVGLEDLLREAERGLAGAFPGLRALFRSTLGDFLLSMGRPEEALEYYLFNYDEAARNMKGIRGLNVVRALLESEHGEGDSALAKAREAYALSGIDPWEYHRPAVLALGMALAIRDPEAADGYLTRFLRSQPASLPEPQRAQASLYLAYSKLARGDEAQARSIVEACAGDLSALSRTGIALLTGPAELFRKLWHACQGEPPALELRLLGRREVLVRGEPTELGLQSCAILALLAHHPNGLSPARLQSDLKPEAGNTASLYAALSKLRRLVPISPPPYRLEVEFAADFLEAERLLCDNELRRALELYRGPLLEDSDAPGIVERRLHIEETFRQATLRSHDPEAGLALAERSVDDLELWEHALASLNPNDPRALLARARVTQLRREY
jgi:hypothetical protein